MIIRNDEGKYAGIRCDHCPREAPPASEVLRGHGLVNMGWRCRGGAHVCPDCRADAIENESTRR